MKYIKTIELWEGSNERMIREGQLKLQCGQWVLCGGNKSRFVSATKHHIHVIHGKDVAEINQKFKAMMLKRVGQ